MVFSNHFACLIFCAFALLSFVHAFQSSIVMTFIVRDEAVNIRANLPLWFDSVDYYVFMVDYRTQDDTYKAIEEVLGGKKQFRNITYDFTGFGPARTASLEAAWEHFPQATHVWIADPDWRPEVDTIKLAQLDFLQRVVPQAEAFRFKIYDRNGFSTRNCDWLLKHRKGLKMKYHLHETIDIGVYAHVAVDFVVHEIEKPGTWHTTVGHGNSMTSKRSLFDLEMLYKDLAMYDHDPHTHYYLGVTHEHVSSQYAKAGIWDNTTEWHFEMALKFMNLRLRSYYTDEFTEERWGVMLALSQLLREYRGDVVLAEYWQKACRSLSPHQIDCSMSLVRTYLSLGNLKDATELLKQILQVERRDRIMLNHFRLHDCDLPVYVLELFGYNSVQASADVPSAANFNDLNHAKYALMAISMARRQKCEGPHQAYQITESGLLLEYAKTGFAAHGIKLDYNTLQADGARLCLDMVFREFLETSGYTMHICDDLRQQLQQQALCKPFNTFLPAAFEDYQIMSFGEFVGAANLPDVAHHVYGGDITMLLSPGVTRWRVLFAEFFNPKLLYSLIGSVSRPAQQSIVVELEMVVLSPTPEVRENIRVAMDKCAVNEGVKVSVEFLDGSLADLMKYDDLTMKKYRNYFNYIEYYGGTGDESTVVTHLAFLKQMLSDTGVIGFTHFTKNVHVDNLRRMFQNRNEQASTPFSAEGERLVAGYLTYTRDLAQWNRDETLIKYLSGCNAETAGLFYSPSEVMNLVSETGLKIRSWVPTAYSHPFDELPHYQIQQFYDYGVQSEDFLHSTLFTFRKTVYLSLAEPGGQMNAPGTGRASVESFEAYVVNDRADTTVANSYDALIADNIMVIDRSGYLGSLLRSGKEYANKGTSMNMGLSFHAAPQFNFSITYQPNMLHGLSLLGTRPTVGAIFAANVAGMKKMGVDLDASALLKSHWATLSMLGFYERLNLISFVWTDKASFLAKVRAKRRVVDRYTKVKSVGSAAHNAQLELEREQGRDAHIPQGQLSESTTVSAATTSTTTATANTAMDASASTAASSSASATKPSIKLTGNGSSRNPLEYLKKTLKGKKRTDASPSVSTNTNTNTNTAADSATSTSRVELDGTSIGIGSEKVVISADSNDAELASKVAQLRAMGISEAIIAQTVRDFEKSASGSSSGDSAAAGAKLEVVEAQAQVEFEEEPALVATPRPKTELKDISAKTNSKNQSKTKGKTSNKNKKDKTSDIAANASAKSSPKKAATKKKKAVSASFTPTVVPQQTMEELLASKRDPSCALKGSHSSKMTPSTHCLDKPNPNHYRISAELTSVSAMKVKFDLSQLRYIALMDPLNAPAIVAKVLPKLQNVNKLIGNFIKYTAMAATRQSFHLTVKEVATLSDGMLNRALHLAKDPFANANSQTSRSPLLYTEAKSNLMASDLDIADADFLVLDMVVNMRSLRSMGSLLLTSTIWFDSMNGQAVAAHHDDGLVHKIFPKFCQEIADTLSHSYPYNVKKYSAVAMDLSPTQQQFSPLFMAQEDEIVVVVWVNPNAIPADEDTETDGLFVFDAVAYDALPDEVAHVNPAIHPDFLTDMGNNFSTHDQAVSTEIQQELFISTSIPRELIQRHSNRLVLIPPHRPFFFSTSNRRDGAYKDALGRKAFDQKTMIAMIIVLAKGS